MGMSKIINTINDKVLTQSITLVVVLVTEN